MFPRLLFSNPLVARKILQQRVQHCQGNGCAEGSRYGVSEINMTIICIDN